MIKNVSKANEAKLKAFLAKKVKKNDIKPGTDKVRKVGAKSQAA